MASRVSKKAPLIRGPRRTRNSGQASRSLPAAIHRRRPPALFPRRPANPAGSLHRLATRVAPRSPTMPPPRTPTDPVCKPRSPPPAHTGLTYCWWSRWTGSPAASATSGTGQRTHRIRRGVRLRHRILRYLHPRRARHAPNAGHLRRIRTQNDPRTRRLRHGTPRRRRQMVRRGLPLRLHPRHHDRQTHRRARPSPLVREIYSSTPPSDWAPKPSPAASTPAGHAPAPVARGQRPPSPES